MKSGGILSAGIGLLAAFSFGCASVPPPRESIAVSEAAVSRAQDAQANEFAPVQFRSAQDKLNNARLAMERGDNLTARELAEQAEADADLAYYTARTGMAQRAAAELQQSIETLKKELQPGT